MTPADGCFVSLSNFVRNDARELSDLNLHCGYQRKSVFFRPAIQSKFVRYLSVDMKGTIIHTVFKFALAFYFLSYCQQSKAQECLGTYGPPVWHVDFGTGPGKPLPPTRSRCQYTSDPCPNDGYYTIIDNVQPCFGGSWLSYPPISANGNFMLINAISGTIYIDTSSYLCGNTNFQFSATVTNVLSPTSCYGHPFRPLLGFQVLTLQGAVLGFYNAAQLVENSPNEYLVQFRMPPGGGPVIVKIIDRALSGCGNDFMLDDITISPCTPSIEAGIANSPGTYIDLCAGDDTVIELSGKIGPGFLNVGYQWQIFDGTNWNDIPGATDINYGRHTTPTGIYKYRLTAADPDNMASLDCRGASNEVTINVLDPTSIATITSNSPVCKNSTINLNATGGISYLWSGPAGFNSTEESPTLAATNETAGQYTVLIEDASGCKRTESTTVNILAGPTATINNVNGICNGDSVTLEASGGTSYSWTPANDLSNISISNPVAKPNRTTTYTVAVNDGSSCTDTANVTVVVHTLPVVNAGGDKEIIKGQSVMLDGNIEDAADLDFNWSNASSLSDIHILNPVANPTANTNYILTAVSGLGCGSSSDTVSVKVYDGLSIPNAFSPNGDGRNDSWHIPALQAFPAAVVSVYNRYGAKIFESTGGKKDWDGKYKNADQPTGAYPYVIDLKNNGSIMKGVVYIIR